jgi:hypothetical protein
MHRIDIELDGGVYVLTCPLCSWERRYYSTENRLDTIAQGDAVPHSGGMGGLEITGVEAKQRDYLEPFRNHLEELKDD